MGGESAFEFGGSKTKVHDCGSHDDFESSNNNGCNSSLVEAKQKCMVVVAMAILSLPTIMDAIGFMWNVNVGGKLLFELQKQK